LCVEARRVEARTRDARRVPVIAVLYSFFFFFQAEDGIRDLIVTGVQTCALPISCCPTCARGRGPRAQVGQHAVAVEAGHVEVERSEERRVGKECRSRGSPGHGKKDEERGDQQGRSSTGRATARDLHVSAASYTIR